MELGIGEVADKFGLSIHTLRYYEKEGLLPFVKRTSSGIRKFDGMSVEALRIVECLKKTGMPLKDIRRFQQWCSHGDDTLEARKEMFHERREVVKKQIAELESVLELVNFKCWYYETAADLGSEEAVLKNDFEIMPGEIRDLYLRTHQ